MSFFWILWGFDALVSLVALYFFMTGLNDGSVSFNMGMWFVILLVLAAIMGGSLWLKSVNQMVLAKLLLFILAIPAFFYLLFILFVIIANPRWN